MNTINREDVKTGDTLVVQTENNTYHALRRDDGTFVVTGGWFDAQSLSPLAVGIMGCTYGGSAIKPASLAEEGMRLEFYVPSMHMTVTTSRIKDARIERAESEVVH